MKATLALAETAVGAVLGVVRVGAADAADAADGGVMVRSLEISVLAEVVALAVGEVVAEGFVDVAGGGDGGEMALLRATLALGGMGVLAVKGGRELMREVREEMVVMA